MGDRFPGLLTGVVTETVVGDITEACVGFPGLLVVVVS